MNGDALSSAAMSVRKLSRSDLPALLSLCLGNPQYYAFLDEEPTMDALAAEMTELPPGCSLDQKSYLGFFDAGGDLFAVLDLIRGYPSERSASSDSSWSVPLDRGGVGSLLISQLLDRLRGEGVSRVRLAYVEGNEQSRHFWRKCGFFEAGAPIDQGEYKVVPMERSLAQTISAPPHCI